VVQGVNWLEDSDILDECVVPQEAHDHHDDHEVRKENNQVVNELLAVAGLENILHLLLVV